MSILNHHRLVSGHDFSRAAEVESKARGLQLLPGDWF